MGSALAADPVRTGGWRCVFDAGFGADWADVPADLRQAVLLLAAEYYEQRQRDGAARAGAALRRHGADRALAHGADAGRGRGMSGLRLIAGAGAGGAACGAGRRWAGSPRPGSALGTLLGRGGGRGGARRAGRGGRLSRRCPIGSPCGGRRSAATTRPRPDQRFRDGARVFRIVAVTERDRDGRYLLCFAREEVPT